MNITEKLGLVWFILGTAISSTSENIVVITGYGILSVIGLVILMISGD